MQTRKSRENNILDKLNDSLSLDQQLLNEGHPIFKRAEDLQVSAEDDKMYRLDDIPLAYPVMKTQNQLHPQVQEGDQIFQTEVDIGSVLENTEVCVLEDYRHKIKNDAGFKPLIQQLVQNVKKKDQFGRAEECIMHNYLNGLGSFSKEKRRAAKRLPPAVLLNG